MTYTFSCPAPCTRVIRIDARNDEDAVGKIIKAGAMTCRNRKGHDGGVLECDLDPARKTKGQKQMMMQSKETLKKMIDFNKASYENTFKNMKLAQWTAWSEKSA